MTRINVVPVEELCDQHLLAEHRELTRIPNGLLTGRLKYYYADRPEDYTLGQGHVKFFTDKLRWLADRHVTLHIECLQRGFNVQDMWPQESFPAVWWNGWKPTTKALALNRARIKDRMPRNARWTRTT